MSVESHHRRGTRANLSILCCEAGDRCARTNLVPFILLSPPVNALAMLRSRDLDAAGILARTHATLPRGLSWHADHSFEGLSAASRHKSPVPSNRQRRQLTHLDIAFNCSRHVTAAKCEQPRISRTARTAPRHNLLMMNVLRLKQHQHLWLNTWFLDMWILTRHNFFLRPSRKTSFLNASSNILARPSFLKDVDPALVLTATPAPVKRALNLKQCFAVDQAEKVYAPSVCV